MLPSRGHVCSLDQLFQGLAVGPICRKFSDRSVLKWSLVGLSGAYLSMVILPLSSFLFSLQTTTSPHPLQTSPMHPTSQPQAIFGTYAVAAIIIVSVAASCAGPFLYFPCALHLGIRLNAAEHRT